MNKSSLSVQSDSPSVDDSVCGLSVVIPIYNEVESLVELVDRTARVLEENRYIFEIICVDDGSNDGSTELLKTLALARPYLKGIILRRNYGQTPALAAGFDYARGDIIVTLDGDLQNDPGDIPRLINQLQEGYDLVSGWRKNRQDNRWSRLLPSKIANWIIARVTGVRLNDYGCSLKAYRSELIADMNLYGELHRFLPALAYIEGAKVSEIVVNHHARRHGKSKYGIDRTIRVILDLMTVFFMKKFITRPMHIFGVLGIGGLLSGSAIGLYLTFLKLVLGQSIGNRPLLTLSILLFLTGIQLLCFGLLAELMIRTYHESQRRPIYRVRSVVSQKP
jgi:glycosyltransferase involved in cell wall biosynthesis